MDEKKLIKTILGDGRVETLQSIAQHAKDIYELQIPVDKSEINQMNKEDMKKTVQKLNMFSGLSSNDVDVLTDLREQALSLWGRPPSTIEGQWIEWCLWHHLRNASSGSAPSGLEAPDLDADKIESYAKDRSGDWKRLVVEGSNRYNSPDDVPDRVRDTLIPE